jgi:hypothetical protein
MKSKKPTTGTIHGNTTMHVRIERIPCLINGSRWKSKCLQPDTKSLTISEKHPIGSGVMHVSTKDMLIY